MNNDKKRGLVAGLVAALLVGSGVVWLLASYFWTAPRADNAAPLVRLRLKWTHQAQFAGFYVADKLGYYKDEGLKVEIAPGGQDLNAIRLVASGDDQFGVWGAEQIMIARSQQIRVMALGVVYQDTAACFMYRADAKINSFKDIEGKRVGVQRGTDVDTIYHALASINNVDLKKVTEVTAQYNCAPFLQGDADVWPSYVVNEPYIAKQNNIPVKLLYPKDNGLHFYGDTVFCTEDYAKKNEKTVKAFMRASLRGWEYSLNNPEEAAKICIDVDKHLGSDPPAQVYMIKESKPFILPSGQRLFRMTDERWMEIHKVLKEQGLLKRDVSVSEIYTNDYLPE